MFLLLNVDAVDQAFVLTCFKFRMSMPKRRTDSTRISKVCSCSFHDSWCWSSCSIAWRDSSGVLKCELVVELVTSKCSPSEAGSEALELCETLLAACDRGSPSIIHLFEWECRSSELFPCIMEIFVTQGPSDSGSSRSGFLERWFINRLWLNLELFRTRCHSYQRCLKAVNNAKPWSSEKK